MAIQSIALNRGLLTELDRCDRSFIMSLYWPHLTNDVLHDKDVADASENDVANTRQGLLMDMGNVRLAIQAAGGVNVVACESGDVWEKVRNTEALLSQPGPLVIQDGALYGDNVIVGFAVLVVRADGMWEVYHLSNKSYASATDKKTLNQTTMDAAPLMYVLAHNYADRIAKFGVVAANKGYLVPYPDPVTGEITVSADEAMHYIDLTDGFGNISSFLPADNPIARANALQAQLESNPFYIPEASMGPQCNKPYVCPYKTYCTARRDPDSVYFHMNSRDAKKLESNGVNLMGEVVDLSYMYPTLQNIPCRDGVGKTFDISEMGLREFRAYENASYPRH